MECIVHSAMQCSVHGRFRRDLKCACPQPSSALSALSALSTLRMLRARWVCAHGLCTVGSDAIATLGSHVSLSRFLAIFFDPRSSWVLVDSSRWEADLNCGLLTHFQYQKRKISCSQPELLIYEILYLRKLLIGNKSLFSSFFGT